MKVVSGDSRVAVDQIPGGGYLVRMTFDNLITAQITGKFTIGFSTFYEWAEVTPLINGSGYELMIGGRFGDTQSNYAAELNSSADVPIGTIVYLRPRVIADTSLLSGSGNIVSLMEFQHFAVQPQSGSIESGSGSGSFESGSVSGSIESGSESGSVSGSVESGSISGSVESGSVVSGSVSGSVESGSVISGSAESGSIISGSVESGSVSGSIESGSISGSVESGSISGSVESGSVESGSVVSGSVESGSISGSLESGSVSGSVESGSISGAISGSEYGPVSGESGSTPCNTSGVLTIEVVTDVQCVNGSIVVTKQTIAIPGGVIC